MEIVTPRLIDVLIVGAGPTGAALAIDLVRRGLNIRVIDRQPTSFPGSRAKGLQPRTLEVFEDLGVLDEVIASGGNYPLLGVHMGPIVVPWRMIKKSRPSMDRPYPNTWMAPQYRTDANLHARLAGLGGRIEFGTELLSFRQDRDSVTASVRAGGSEQTIQARYLVGADGGSSRVRSEAGIGFSGETDEDDRWIIVDAETSGLARNRWHTWPGKGGRMTAACPLPHTTVFQWMFRLAATEPVTLEPQALQELVLARTGDRRVRLGDIGWSTVFRPNIRLAESYRKGRVFLAGDAAHTHTPAGGQGLNTGVQDAYNLGWKLGQVLAGADDALLDTYEAERQPIAEEMLARSTRRYRSIGKANTTSVQRTADERQLDLNYRGGPLAPASVPDNRALAAGDRAPDAVVVGADGARVRLFDLFRGPQFTALAYGPKAAAALAGADWPAGGASLKKVPVNGGKRAGASLSDRLGSLRRIYGLQPDTLLLVRPDGYVALIATRDWASQLEHVSSTLAGRQGDASGATQ